MVKFCTNLDYFCQHGSVVSIVELLDMLKTHTFGKECRHMGQPVTSWQILTKNPDKLAVFHNSMFGWTVNAETRLAIG